MNREIKFRGWDKKRKVMLGTDYDNWSDDDCEEYRPYEQMCISFIEETPLNIILMQYTGLKDKTGKEIYEGDIVQNKAGEVYEVKWGEDDSDGGYISGFSFGYDYPEEDLEVMGNIYQHKELLNGNV